MSETFVVAGASGLIGAPIVEAIVARGDHVIALRRHLSDTPRGDRGGTGVTWVGADLDTEAGVEAALSTIADFGVPVKGFVHAARSRERIGVGVRATSEDWLAEYRMTVRVPYLMAEELARAHGLSSAVILGSIYGMVAQRPSLYDDPEDSLNPQYGASRAAVVQLVRDLAVRLAPQARVNAVSFGGVEGVVSPDFVRRYSREAPFGRMLSVGDVAGPVLFLLSDAASGVTGHNLVVDGGWTAW